MANPWDNDPIIEPAQTTQAPAKKAAPRKYSESAAQAALRQSDAVMNEGLKKLSAPQRKKALANYYASPTIQRLRENAGLPAVRTRTEELADIARKQFRQEKKFRPEGDFGASRRAGSERALFGLSERIGAALNYYGGASDPGVKSYGEELDVQRMVNEMQRGRSTSGNVLGQILGGVTGGSAAATAVRSAGGVVASVAPRTGRFIQGLTTLEKGRRGANAAKIVAGGAAGGAAQAAGEGSDVTTGAVTGAIAAPLVMAGFKGAEWATRPVRDFLRLSGAKSILGRTISMTREQVEAAAERFRRATGTEPTLFEILPTADRRAVTNMVKKRLGDAPRERVTENVRSRVAAMPGELATRTAQLTAPQQRFIAQNIARDLAASRGASRATPDEIALAQRATRDPTEMEQVRRTVNQNIMGPLDDRVAYGSVNDLIPTIPVNQGNGRIAMQVADEQMAATIRGAAGSLRLRDDIRVQDVTRLLSRLRATADRGGVEGDAAQSAINHIEDIMARDHPDVADAMARMNAAHAERSRMLEAIPEGRATRLREDVPVTTGRAARGVRQAYDTAEGAAGRAIGQRAEIMTDFGRKPDAALSRARQISEDSIAQEAISRNLGPQAGQGIAEASAAQAESLRRLAALRNPVNGDEADADFGDLAMATSLLSPTSLIRTKSQAIGTILRMVNGIPEARANQLVDALFSRDPRQIAQAARLLDGAGEQARRALRDIAATVAIGAQANSINAGINESRGAADAGMQDAGTIDPAPVSDTPVNPDAPWEADPIVDENAGEGLPYGHAVIQSIFPDAVITDDERDPNSGLGRANPDSFHNTTDGAVDVRPIPGMTFDEFVAAIEAEGHQILEAIDEVNNPSGHATGPHWHVVIA